MAVDFRMEWIKQKTLKMLGLKNEEYFNRMLSSKKDLEESLLAFFDDEFLRDEDRQFFCVYKTPQEKLIEQETVVSRQVRRKKVVVEEVKTEEAAKKKKIKEKKVKRGKKVQAVKSEPVVENIEGGFKKVEEESTTTPTKEEDDLPPKSAESPDDTQVTETDASTLPSPEYTDVEAEMEGTPRGTKGKTKKKKKEKGGRKNRKKKVVQVESSADEAELEEITEYVTEMVPVLVTDYMLHGIVHNVTEVPLNPDYRFIYFYRKTDHGLPDFDNEVISQKEMPNYFLVGISTGNILHTLNVLTKSLHSCLLMTNFNDLNNLKQVSQTNSEFKRPSDFRKISIQNRKKPSHSDIEEKSNEQSDTHMCVKGELVDEIAAFSSALDWVNEHVDDELDLPMTDLTDILILEDDRIAADPSLVANLEDVVMGWERHIVKIIDNFLAKAPTGTGPLAEFEFWHDRETAFSSLVEQLKKPTLLRISNILEHAKSNVIDAFTYYQLDLKRYYSQAKDNVQFLSTILRQMKTITNSEDFWKIKECIPDLIDGIHLIWVLSSYYNTDDVMVPFMERIINCLLEKVRKKLHNETLFRLPIGDVLNCTAEAKEMLEVWRQSYNDTRQKIEESGRGQRWEFDKRRLFNASDYMAFVCKDLHDVATIVYHFKNIFGAELRAIVSDPQSIDNIAKRVDRLIIQIENTDFDIFDANCKENWEAIMQHFHKEVKLLELDGIKIIDQSFKMVRSAESALEMLIKFKHIETRQVILDRLMMKFDLILDQYMKELLAVEDNFVRNKRHPILCRTMPQHCGAIYWVRLLYYKLKRPILQFQKVPELMKSPLKAETFKTYLRLAKELKAYEQDKIEDFLEQYGPIMEKAMQMDILKLSTVNKKSTFYRVSKAVPSTFARVSILSKNKVKISSRSATPTRSVFTIMERIHSQRNLTWHEIMGDYIVADIGLQFDVNFDTNLWTCLKSVEILETLQFSLPDNLRMITLRKEKIQRNVNAVTKMVNMYNEIVEQLTEPQQKKQKQSFTWHLKPQIHSMI